MSQQQGRPPFVRAVLAGVLAAAAVAGTAYGLTGPGGSSAKPKDKVLAASFDARDAILGASDASDEAAQLAAYKAPKVEAATALAPRVVQRATRVVVVKAKAKAKAKAKPKRKPKPKPVAAPVAAPVAEPTAPPAAPAESEEKKEQDEDGPEQKDQHEDEDKVEDRGEDD
jgi:hypothetical protein